MGGLCVVKFSIGLACISLNILYCNVFDLRGWARSEQFTVAAFHLKLNTYRCPYNDEHILVIVDICRRKLKQLSPAFEQVPHTTSARLVGPRQQTPIHKQPQHTSWGLYAVSCRREQFILARSEPPPDTTRNGA